MSGFQDEESILIQQGSDHLLDHSAEVHHAVLADVAAFRDFDGAFGPIGES